MNKPSWIRTKLSWDEGLKKVDDLLTKEALNTVCVEAACPNKTECWQKRHVTFMILGDKCTRSCRFCNVAGGRSVPLDLHEPKRIARMVKRLGMRHVVITSVTRDDLLDKGAEQFTKTVRGIKSLCPDVTVELLIPDLDAKFALLEKIVLSGPDIIGHNMEMPKALYPKIRPKASYERSLNVLSILNMMKEETFFSLKSSLILGLGENENDILSTLKDMRIAGVDIVYMGQYLSPSPNHWPVKRYYTPREFENLKEKAEAMKFHTVSAGPLVRSSYKT